MPRAGSGISRSATPSSGRLFLRRRDARLRGAVGENPCAPGPAVRINSRWWNPRGVRPAIHPGQTAGGGTRAAFGQRSIPAKQPVVEPTRRSASDPSRPNRVAARRSSLRFGRNTLGIPPSRALSAGRLAGLGAHADSTTGYFTASLRAAHRCVSVEIHSVFLPHAPCQPGASPASALTRIPPPAISPRRCAPLIVAFRSKYTRYSSLTRLVSRAPRPHRENWPASALTRVPPQAVRRTLSAGLCQTVQVCRFGRGPEARKA